MQFTAAPRPPEVSHDGPEPSIADALRLWRHLFGDRQDLVGLYSACWTGRGDNCQLGNWQERYFRVNQLEEAATWVAREDRNGRDCYFAVAQLLAKQRIKDNAAPSRVVHADMDGAPLEPCPIRPTAVVETSPGHFHAYWRLSRLVQPHKAEELNRRLVLAIGADKAAVDSVRLMRCPGTHNRKRPGEWANVQVVWIDDERTVDPNDLERVLPKLPIESATPYRFDAAAAVSDDDQELLASVLEQPQIARVWQGDIAEYPSQSDAEWALARELMRACGLDVERAESIMRRCEALHRDKWDERRGNESYLRRTLRRAAEQNVTPYRSDDPTNWPEFVAEIPDGPANGKCSDHCKLRHHPKETALRRQIELVNELIQSDLSPVFKLTLLRLVAIVGYYQSRGTTRFQTSAKKIGESIGLSAQSVRSVLHALARQDLTKDPGETLNNERGLIDLDSTRVPEAGEFCRVFDITPLTEGGYTGFLEAVVAIAPDLPAPPKHAPRQKHEEVKPPPEVVPIPGCPDHYMHSDVVVCAGCEAEFIREVRYRQNVTPYRSESPPLLWDSPGDIPQRSAFFDPLEERRRLDEIYERAVSL